MPRSEEVRSAEQRNPLRPRDADRAHSWKSGRSLQLETPASQSRVCNGPSSYSVETREPPDWEILTCVTGTSAEVPCTRGLDTDIETPAILGTLNQMSGRAEDTLPTALELGGLNAAAARAQPQAIEALTKLLGSPAEDIRVALSKVHGRTLVRNVFGAEFTYASGEAWEAVDDEGGTGIEEEIEDEPDHVRPYDPDKIRVDPKTFSLQQLLDDIGSGDLDLAPDFQRNKVWGPRQKVRLVESVLLRIPLPAFYFSADKSGRFSVVDGVQRLSTLHGFLNDEFALTKGDLEYLTLDVLSVGTPRPARRTQIAVGKLNSTPSGLGV